MLSSICSYLQLFFLAFILNACFPDQNHLQNAPQKVPEISKADSTREELIIEVDSSISLEYLVGKFDPKKDKRFVLITKQYSSRAALLMRKEAYEAFQEMHKSAQQAGISLKILSATRNFQTQKSIWEAKWSGVRKLNNGVNASKVYSDPKARALKILEYSSMPGTSRHHWGTDIDINNLNNAYFQKGKGLKEYEWLKKNAAKFGFCQPYTAGRTHGYQEERWHWSYMPLAQKLTQQAKLRLKDEQINGFKGSETASEIQVVKHYVLGINRECL